MSDLLKKARAFLTDQHIRETAVVVAVSGGPDSVALLRALASLRDEFALGPLVIAHLNHHLRGKESDADQAFVFDLYQQMETTEPGAFLWRVNTIPVQEHKSPGENLESAARALRYQWLTDMARECGASYVATGHTAGDQAETVLHRLLRGTGINGLAAIAPRRPLATGVELIRPMLDVNRAEVTEFLEQLNQPSRLDSSNLDPRFTRNRIRRELLPLLERDYNPAVADILCRVARQAQELRQDVEAEAARLLEQAEMPRAGSLLIFDAVCLEAASRRQLAEMFLLVWRRENWPMQSMGFREWTRLARVARGEMPATDLPGPLRIRRHGRVVQVGRPVRA